MGNIRYMNDDPFENLINTRGGIRHKAIREVCQALVDDETEHVNIDIRVKIATQLLLMSVFNFVAINAKDDKSGCNIATAYKLVELNEEVLHKILLSTKDQQSADAYEKYSVLFDAYRMAAPGIKEHAQYLAIGTLLTHYYHSFFQYAKSSREFLNSFGYEQTNNEKKTEISAHKKEDAERTEQVNAVADLKKALLAKPKKHVNNVPQVEAEPVLQEKSVEKKPVQKEKKQEEKPAEEKLPDIDEDEDFFKSLLEDVNQAIQESKDENIDGESKSESDDTNEHIELDDDFDPTDFMDDNL